MNRLKPGCCEHLGSSVGRARAVMPHGGLGERFVCEPVPPGPEALFTFGRGPDVASRHRLAAELTSSLPKLARRNALMGAPAVCLHNQNACTNRTVTHSAGPRTPLARWCRSRGNHELIARESRRWQATSERPEPSGSGRSTEVDHPSPVAALAEARPFPANGARPRETMHVVRRTPLLAE